MTGHTPSRQTHSPHRGRRGWGRVGAWALPVWVVGCVAVLTHLASLWVIPRIVNAPLLGFASAAAVQGVWRPPSLGVQTDSLGNGLGATADPAPDPPSQAAPWADPGALLAICPVDLQRQPVLHLRWRPPVLKAPGHWQVLVLSEDGQLVLSQQMPSAPPPIDELNWWVYASQAVGGMAPEGAQLVQVRHVRALVAVRVWPAVGDMAAARSALQALRCSNGIDDEPAR